MSVTDGSGGDLGITIASVEVDNFNSAYLNVTLSDKVYAGETVKIHIMEQEIFGLLMVESSNFTETIFLSFRWFYS